MPCSQGGAGRGVDLDRASSARAAPRSDGVVHDDGMLIIAAEADATAGRVDELHCQTLSVQDLECPVMSRHLECPVMSRRWAGRREEGA